MRFICISINLIKNLEEILKKFQISINQILCANYIESLFEHDEIDVLAKTRRVLRDLMKMRLIFIKKQLKT